MSLTDQIKDFALDLGYSRAGVTSAEGFPEYAAELEARREMYAFFIDTPRQPLKGAYPASLVPGARSIITLVYDYAKESFPENLVGKIGRLYQSRCHNAPEHRMGGMRPRLMLDFLRQNGCPEAVRITLPERAAAARAGLVGIGENTFAYAEGIGSFISLHSFVVAAELEYDEGSADLLCPPGCTACLDACPTAAVYEPYKMNPQRCIAFHNTSSRELAPQGGGYAIPREIREKTGAWIHGCDACQDACPLNRKRIGADLPQDEFLADVARDFDLPGLLEMTDEFFARRVRPVMYNYMTEKKFFQRNAAIAMGNTGDAAYVPHLARAMEAGEELVRGYAAWALGRIGGQKAKGLLESARARETAPAAKSEMEAALAEA